MTIYEWKRVVVYSLLALLLVHAGAAIVYHSMIRKDGVLRSMLPRSWGSTGIAIAAAALIGLAPDTGGAQTTFDANKSTAPTIPAWSPWTTPIARWRSTSATPTAPSATCPRGIGR